MVGESIAPLGIADGVGFDEAIDLERWRRDEERATHLARLVHVPRRGEAGGEKAQVRGVLRVLLARLPPPSSRLLVLTTDVVRESQGGVSQENVGIERGQAQPLLGPANRFLGVADV